MKKQPQLLCRNTLDINHFRFTAMTQAVKSTKLVLFAIFVMLTPAKSFADDSSNTFTGANAFLNITTGTNNSAYGYFSLYLNTTGYNNTAMGAFSLSGAGPTYVTGYDNTAIGVEALASNTTGSVNNAIGFGALISNTSGNYNSANGVWALYTNTSGSFNTANGYDALFYNTLGNNNTANGQKALLSNTTGSFNTADGNNALLTNTTGSNNTALGTNADVASGNLTNATAIGYGAIVTNSNSVRLGNTKVTTLRAQVPLTTTSDKRLKSHISDLTLGADFINKLHPVEYIRTNDASQTKEWGVIAQEVQQTLHDIGYKNAGVVNAENTPEKYLSVRYNDLLAPMIKAIQEQHKIIEAQKTDISALLKRVEALEKK